MHKTTLRHIPSSKAPILAFHAWLPLQILHDAIQVVLTSALSSQKRAESINSARVDARFAMAISSVSTTISDTRGYNSNLPAHISGHLGFEHAPPAVAFRCQAPS